MDIKDKLGNESIENYIIDYFKKYELGEYGELDNNTRKQLESIEKYFIICDGELNELLKRRNKIKLDIVGVSTNVEGLGRTTIYKKDILKIYINKRIGSIINKHKEIMISERYNLLEEKYRESATLIDQVKIELIDSVENKVKIEKLEEQVKKINSITRRLESEKIQYVERIYMLEKKLRVYREKNDVENNVVSIIK